MNVFAMLDEVVSVVENPEVVPMPVARESFDPDSNSNSSTSEIATNHAVAYDSFNHRMIVAVVEEIHDSSNVQHIQRNLRVDSVNIQSDMSVENLDVDVDVGVVTVAFSLTNHGLQPTNAGTITVSLGEPPGLNSGQPQYLTSVWQASAPVLAPGEVENVSHSFSIFEAIGLPSTRLTRVQVSFEAEVGSSGQRLGETTTSNNVASVLPLYSTVSITDVNWNQDTDGMVRARVGLAMADNLTEVEVHGEVFMVACALDEKTRPDGNIVGETWRVVATGWGSLFGGAGNGTLSGILPDALHSGRVLLAVLEGPITDDMLTFDPDLLVGKSEFSFINYCRPPLCVLPAHFGATF